MIPATNQVLGLGSINFNIFYSPCGYANYPLCPKKNVILEILGQIIKEVK
jgi:hypothetical protein